MTRSLGLVWTAGLRPAAASVQDQLPSSARTTAAAHRAALRRPGPQLDRGSMTRSLGCFVQPILLSHAGSRSPNGVLDRILLGQNQAKRLGSWAGPIWSHLRKALVDNDKGLQRILTGSA